MHGKILGERVDDNRNAGSYVLLDPVERHVIVHIDEEQLYEWVRGEVATVKSDGPGGVPCLLKQTGTTLVAWILVLELGGIGREAGVKEAENFVLRILTHVHEQKNCIDIVVPENGVAKVFGCPAVEVVETNRHYHHMLPGVLLRIRRAAETEQKENIDSSKLSNRKLLGLFQSFPLFHSCFACIDHMASPPTDSSLIPHDTRLWLHTEVQEEQQHKVSSHHKKLVLPSQAVTFIIGKKGKSIEHIRQQTNAIIKIHESSLDSGGPSGQSELIGPSNTLQLVSIDGSRPDVELAQALIEEKVRLWKSQQLFVYQHH